MIVLQSGKNYLVVNPDAVAAVDGPQEGNTCDVYLVTGQTWTVDEPVEQVYAKLVECEIEWEESEGEE